MKRKIVLASTSLRRKEILEQLGLDFKIHGSDFEEDMTVLKDPIKLVEFLSFKKTEDVARHYKEEIVVGGDTFVIHKGKFLGKPKTKAEAERMLRSLSDNKCEVISGFCVIDTKSKKVFKGYDKTIVKFSEMTGCEIKAYLSLGKALDRAGAFGVQDEAAVFIKEIQGNYHTVLGFPSSKIYPILKKLGVKVF